MIYLLRHGEIDTEGGRRFIGQLDIGLTEEGKKQAERWRKKLSEIRFDLIYSSDLIRCSETAGIIDAGNNIIFSKELREIDLGEWDGLYISEVKNDRREEWEARGTDIVGYTPPGGESFIDLKNRVSPVFNELLKKKTENILVITHAGVIRTIICSLLEIPFAKLFSIGLDYAGMNIIDNSKEPVRLMGLNNII